MANGSTMLQQMKGTQYVLFQALSVERMDVHKVNN